MLKTNFKNEFKLVTPVKLGSRGENVGKVQEWLNLWRYIDSNWFCRTTIDDIFGPQTETMVINFQKQHGLQMDGKVGKKTWAQLHSPIFNAYCITEFSAMATLSDRIIQFANQHLMSVAREIGGNNMGPWVRAYMDGNEGRPWAWCVGFVQTVLDMAISTTKNPDGSIKKFTDIMPKSYSCDVVANYGLEHGKLIRNKDLRKDPDQIKPGDVFFKVKTPTDWVHTGIVSAVNGKWIHTIEGNSNDEGVREGFEVCASIRNIYDQNIDIYKIIKKDLQDEESKIQLSKA